MLATLKDSPRRHRGTEKTRKMAANTREIKKSVSVMEPYGLDFSPDATGAFVPGAEIVFFAAFALARSWWRRSWDCWSERAFFAISRSSHKWWAISEPEYSISKASLRVSVPPW